MTKATGLSRRRLLKGAAGGSALLIASPTVITSALAQSRTVYVNTWGGSWTAAEDAAFFKPFTKETGIAVRTVAPFRTPSSRPRCSRRTTSGMSPQLQRATGCVPRTRASSSQSTGPSWTSQSCSRTRCTPTGSVTARSALTSYIARTSSRAAARRTGPTSGTCRSFPGNRSLYNNPIRAVTFALLADGVPKDKLFPLDLDRAFKKLERDQDPTSRCGGHKGNQSQQLLRDGEIDMMAMWNARAQRAEAAGRAGRVVWDGATIHTTMWGVAKGAPKREGSPGSLSSSRSSRSPGRFRR